MRKFRRVIAVLISASLIFETFPVSAAQIAEKSKDSSKTSSNSSISSTSESTQPKIISEITEKRTANTEQFKMSDGTYMVAEYPYPVHYQENGVWKDIDNTFLQKSDQNSVTSNRSNAITEEKINDTIQSGYENNDNKIKVKIANAANEKNQIRVKSDQYQISWGLSDQTSKSKNNNQNNDNQKTDKPKLSSSSSSLTSKLTSIVSGSASVSSATSSSSQTLSTSSSQVSSSSSSLTSSSGTSASGSSASITLNRKATAKLSQKTAESNALNASSTLKTPDEIKKYNDQFLTKTKVNSSSTYSEVYPGVDLTYNLISNIVREDLVLKNSACSNSYTFNYSLDNLEMRKANDGSIEVYNPQKSDQVVYTIRKPYMYDANGKASDNVQMDFDKTEDGYTVTVTADGSWIKNPARKFPVVIDPDLQPTFDRSAIHETFVATNTPDKNYTSYGSLHVGHETSEYGICRTYVKFDLPTLSKTSKIISAALELYQYNASPANLSNYQIDLHAVTGNLDTAALTWNNQPSFNPSTSDYSMVDGSQNLREWNITQIASDWYSTGNNNGLVLKARNESTATDVQFYSSDYPNLSSSGYPAFVYSYRDTVGLEDYWTYHSQDAGRAGTGYINDFNGNVTWVHDDLDESGNRMPAAVQHVFNNASVKSSADYNNQRVKFGNGWMISVEQKLVSTGITDYPYKYIDADGTEHYFEHDSSDPAGTYRDEDGLGLKLTQISEGNITSRIDEKDNSYMKFDEWGYLHSVTDSNNNTITYNYGPAGDGENYLANIVDGAGRVTHFDYDLYGDFSLSDIVDSSGRVTSFTYSDGRLSVIRYPDGNSTEFTYDQNGCLKNIYTFDTGAGVYSVQYSYHAQAPYRASSVCEKTENGIYGKQLSDITYGTNQTKFTDNLGRSETFHFDNYGRTIDTVDDQGSASYYKFTDTDGDSNSPKNDSTKHTLSMKSSLQKPVINLICNGSAEYDGGFSGGNWGQSTNYSIGYTSETSYIGNRSIKISDSGGSNVNLVDLYMVNLTGGKDYTFSAYVKTSEISGSGGACIQVGGNNNWVKSESVTGTHDWTREYVTFNVPSSGTYYMVLNLQGATGTSYFDGMQLEEGDCANRLNLIDNPGMDNVSGSMPTSWSGVNTNSATDYACSDDKRSGNYSFQMVGDANTKKYITQQVNVSGNSGDSLVFGGWAKADSVPVGNRWEGFTAEILLFNGSNYVGGKAVNFNDANDDWQYLSDVYVAPGSFTSVYFYLLYANNSNTVRFDDAQLFKDEFGQSYQYDSKGNLVTSQALANQKSTFDYNSSNDLIKAAKPTGASFYYNYDTNHNVTNATNQSNVKYSFQYDSYGNPVSTAAEGGQQSDIQNNKVYYIKSSQSSLYLDVNGAIDSNLTKVIQHEFNGGNHQKWRVVDVGGGYYKLVAQNSATGRCLDVYNGSNTDGAGIDICDDNSTNAQKWKITKNTDGTYSFYSACSNNTKCLDVQNGNIDNGGTLDQYTSNGTQSQKFVFEPATDLSGNLNPAASVESGSKYYIQSNFSKLFIEPYNASTESLAQIVQNSRSGKTEQRWMITQNSDGYYTILNEKSNLALDVYNASNTDGAKIQLYTPNGSSAQEWKIDKNSDGTFKIIAKCSNDTKGLDVSDTSMDPNHNIHLWTYIGASNQCWNLIPISDSTLKTQSGATYTSDGNYLSSLTDSSGNTVHYNYDTNKGTLNSQTDAGGHTTNYTYDANTNDLKSVSKTVNGQTVANSYNYQNDQLSSITHNGFNYTFAYDPFGNTTNVKVGSQDLITNTYAANNGNLMRAAYGNGQSVDYTYDTYDRVTDKKSNGTDLYQWAYNAAGKIGLSKDFVNNVQYRFTYDLANRITAIAGSNGQKTSYTYDKYNNMSKKTDQLNTNSYTASYSYTRDNLAAAMTLGQNDQVSWNYDGLNRLKNKQFRIQSGSSYNTYTGNCEYMPGSGSGTTCLLSKLSYVKNVNGADTAVRDLSYTYDANGNIQTISEGGTQKVKYAYDELNELTREDNLYLNQSITYAYDAGGNITSKKVYPYTTGALGTATATHSYGYGDGNWKDKLTSYDGNIITYDAIGNPLSYVGGWNFTWQQGRQLAAASNGSTSISCKYNSDGQRTSKTVNGVTTNYYIEDGDIAWQTDGTNTIHYTYDSDDNAEYMNLNGQLYYYERNGQGDIIGIVDSNMNEVVSYSYDTWGKLLGVGGSLASTVGTINPLRYRGYYYDTETGLYSLQSRYYDPQTGRFLNADDTDVLSADKGHLFQQNLFAYCLNNPVNHSDPNGDWVLDAIFLAADVADMVMHPSVGGAAWILLDCASFADPSGAAAAGAHALKAAHSAYKAFKAVEDTEHIANIAKKVIHVGDRVKSVALKAFEGHGGYGYKIGKKIEVLYKNPKVKGGTILSYKGKNRKFRVDIDSQHYLHYHYKSRTKTINHRKIR